MSIQLTKNFNSREFDSPDAPNSGINISRLFVHKLQRMRDIYGKPIVIISGVRTKKRNKKVGGVPNSTHMLFTGADIKVKKSRDMFLLLNAALQVGFVRIGVNNGSMHLDNSYDKPQDVIWTYY